MSEIAKCPKCGKSIDEIHENSWCTSCGEPLPSAIKSQLPRLAALAAASAAASHATQVAAALNSEPLAASVTARVAMRYRDAYRVGSALVALGNAIKIVGAVVGAIIAFLGLTSGGAIALAGLVFGAIGGGLFWLFGVVVAAQGQILRATLDNAVANSPFLTDVERLQAMGIGTSQLPHASHMQTPEPTLKPGDMACKHCGRAITLSDRQVCRDKQLCEDHL